MFNINFFVFVLNRNTLFPPSHYPYWLQQFNFNISTEDEKKKRLFSIFHFLIKLFNQSMKRIRCINYILYRLIIYQLEFHALNFVVTKKYAATPVKYSFGQRTHFNTIYSISTLSTFFVWQKITQLLKSITWN